MVQSISATGLLAQNLFSIQRNQQLYDDLNYQVATGKKYRSLRNYDTQAVRIVDLNSDIESRTGYVKAIDIAQITTKTYDETLSNLANSAQKLLDQANPLSAIDADWTVATKALVDNLMLDVQSSLNLEVGGRYIYAGTRYDQPPVKNLTQLAVYVAGDAGTADPVESANNLPQISYNGGASTQSWHTQWTAAGDTDAQSWTEVSLNVAQGQQVKYGITAANPAMQNLIEGLLRLKSAVQTGLTQTQRDAFLKDARLAAQTAHDQLRELQASNGIVMNELDGAKTSHENFINISQIALDDLTGADTNTAAVKLSTLTTQMQASYSTIATSSKLSLVNYL